jgi:hypothetical protein
MLFSPIPPEQFADGVDRFSGIVGRLMWITLPTNEGMKSREHCKGCLGKLAITLAIGDKAM